MYLSELANRIKGLDILRLMDEGVEENAEYIADLNTSQLSIGIDSKGEALQEYADPEYAKMKIAIGSKAPLGTPNLYVEGNFYEGFFVEPLKSEPGGIFISSTDSKTSKLSKKYGNNIFGLTDQSLIDLKSVTLPLLLTKIRNELLR